MKKIAKARKICDILYDKYHLRYLDTRRSWNDFDCFQDMKPTMTISEIIFLLEDYDEYQMIVGEEYKIMFLKNNNI